MSGQKMIILKKIVKKIDVQNITDGLYLLKIKQLRWVELQSSMQVRKVSKSNYL